MFKNRHRKLSEGDRKPDPLRMPSAAAVAPPSTVL